MQEGEEKQKSDNSSDKTSEEKPVCCQGAYSKVRKTVSRIESKSCMGGIFQNGPGSQINKAVTCQNGAGCSSWLSSSTTSSSTSLNEILGSDSNSLNDVDKGLDKNFELPQKSDAVNNARKRFVNNDDNYNSSGNEGDEALSGDDCCIYTYKGDQFADLPNSFFPVHLADREGDQHNRDNHNGGYPRGRNQLDERSNPGSSPEMDYLEMDFDPGPSLEHDSEDIDGLLEQTINGSPVPDLPAEQSINITEDINDSRMEYVENIQEPKPGPSNEGFYLCSPKDNNNTNYCSRSCTFNSTIRTTNNLDQTEQCSEEIHDNCVCEKVKTTEYESDIVNACMNQTSGSKRLDRKNQLADVEQSKGDEKKVSDSKSPFDGIMLWTEQEAISNQVTMLTSEVSCGATAVINVMLVLKMRFSIENVKEGICTRLKSDSASIPQFLVSRSFAGVAHENLVRGIHHASHGTLYAKFFQMYPRRDIVLSRWLTYWMKLGAVPIATMNVQRDSSTESSVNDTRHHQMVFGVSSKGIYLTNPLECLQDEELWSRLTSPSVLNIRRQEIVSRWSPDTNLKPLMFQSDDRWKTMNVLGQVVNIIRESPDPSAQGKFLTQHISIPACSGITLVIPRNLPGYEELVSTPDLPLCSESNPK